MKFESLLIPLLISTLPVGNVEEKYELDNSTYRNSHSQILSQEHSELEVNLTNSRAITISNRSNSYYSDEYPSDEDIAFGFLAFLGFILLPLFWEPSRKAAGLLNIIIGTIISFTGIGALIGIPMIFFGGILLFI